MSWVIALDPGDTQSAFVVYDGDRERSVLAFGKEPNEDVLFRLRHGDFGPTVGTVECAHLAIEMIASYGMPVGREVFETCVWIGRFVEAWGNERSFVYRRDVKLHLCGSARAKDGNVRQALIDKFGGKAAIGTKKQPGVLYGIKADIWQALAVAVTYDETREAVQP